MSDVLMEDVSPASIAHVLMGAREEAMLSVLASVLDENAVEFIRVFNLHISDVILTKKRTGFAEQIIAHIERNPRGCKGKTHVQIQNGPTQCYENICEVMIKPRQMPETD